MEDFALTFRRQLAKLIKMNFQKKEKKKDNLGKRNLKITQLILL